MNVKPLLISVVILNLLSPHSYAHQKHCKDTTLGEHMETMKSALKQLAKEYKAKQLDQLTRHSQAIRQSAIESRTLKPLKLHAIQSERQVKFMSDYQQEIDVLLQQLDQLDQAIALPDYSAINTVLKTINQHSKKSHKQFRMECD